MCQLCHTNVHGVCGDFRKRVTTNLLVAKECKIGHIYIYYSDSHVEHYILVQLNP